METAQKIKSEFVKPKFKESKKIKWIYSGIAVLVVLGSGSFVAVRALRGSAAIPQSDIHQVSTGNVVQTISTSGTIQVPQEISLNFTGVSGLVKTVSVKIGQQVKAGQLLAQLDDPSAPTQVTQAQANLLSAEAKLTQTEQGGTSAQVAQDKLNVQKAQQTLTAAQQSYKDQLAVYNDRSAASQTVINAQNTLQKDQATAANTTSVNSAQQNLQAAQASFANAQTALQQAESQYGTITAAQVASAYQTLIRDEGANALQTQISADQTLYNQYNTAFQAIQQAQNAVTSAQNQVNQDQNALATAQQQYVQAQNQVQVDEQNLQYAQQQFNDRTSAQQQLDSANNAVAQDKLALASAQATLKADTSPPDQATLQQVQAAVTSAQASLEAAQATVASTELKAPINGVVTQVNLQAGETPSAGSSSSGSSGSTAAIVIDDINKSDLQVNLQVSESQIGGIQSGQSVKFTVPAYPGQTFSGTITTVYPTPQVVSNVTEYTVLATIDDSSGKLKTGMTANAVIQTAEHDNVVMIPAVALQQVGNLEGVYVYGTPTSTSTGFGGGNSSAGQHNFSGGTSGGTSGGFSGGNRTFQGGSQGGTQSGTQRRGSGGASAIAALSSKLKLPKGVYFQPVQTGLMGVSDVEITRGLTAGEKILLALPGQSAATTTSSSSQGGRSFGGGVKLGGGGSRG